MARVRYLKAGGSGNLVGVAATLPLSFLPSKEQRNKDILLHKGATWTKHFDGQCMFFPKPKHFFKRDQNLTSTKPTICS